MLEKPLTYLLIMGSQQEFLERVANESTDAKDTAEAIAEFLTSLEELGLTVTLRAAAKLRTMHGKLSKQPADSKLRKADHEHLRGIMKVLWPTLSAEGQGTIAYIISERRFPIERLIGGVDKLFAEGVFKKLPIISQEDFSESAKCLAFERGTAAAFHMLRGTESILKHYYCSKISRKRASLMWGPMVASMRNYPRRFPEPLLNHLDHIRNSFRNPTAHPEKSFDIDEAQDLFSICIEVANRMIQDMK